MVTTALGAARAWAGAGLLSVGAWLAYEPAGFMVAGVLLLADRLADGWRDE